MWRREAGLVKLRAVDRRALLPLVLATACGPTASAPPAPACAPRLGWVGGDLSFASQLEALGVGFRVGGAFDANWPGLAALLEAAADGVRAGAGPAVAPKIMIHIDRGGDPEAATWFFDRLARHGVTYDLIGLSFYPWWHGRPADLQRTLTALERFERPVVLVEVAHPFTLTDHDPEPNFVSSPGDLLSGHPATPEGQRDYLDALLTIAADAGVQGLYWWAPDFVAAAGLPSPWDNMTLFDDERRALVAFDALCAPR